MQAPGPVLPSHLVWPRPHLTLWNREAPPPSHFGSAPCPQSGNREWRRMHGHPPGSEPTGRRPLPDSRSGQHEQIQSSVRHRQAAPPREPNRTQDYRNVFHGMEMKAMALGRPLRGEKTSMSLDP
ncbi:hypothetical protein ACCO45_005523 [Purpureocillium lilacinum]|uniref:Uncharacterized protein n=1 Tax=Purpureocillium lilacinum TaxID=33203 RepID=A0ACC4DVN5_PURLI